MNEVIDNGFTEMMHEFGRHITKALSNKYGFDLEEAWEHIESLKMIQGERKKKIRSSNTKEKKEIDKKETGKETNENGKETKETKKTKVLKSTRKGVNAITPIPLLKGDLEENILIEVIKGKKYCVEENTGSVYHYKTENDGERGEFIGILKDGQVLDYFTP